MWSGGQEEGSVGRKARNGMEMEDRRRQTGWQWERRQTKQIRKLRRESRMATQAGLDIYSSLLVFHPTLRNVLWEYILRYSICEVVLPNDLPKRLQLCRYSCSWSWNPEKQLPWCEVEPGLHFILFRNVAIAMLLFFFATLLLCYSVTHITIKQ
jgi:hypothetical protein